MKICILHIGHTEPGEKPKHPPSPQRFENALASYLPGAEWTVISAVKETLPPADAFDAYLITGGKYSVFEELEWQDRLFDLIRELDRKSKTLLGICYGHQAIAHALGGKVERSVKGWGVGLMAVDAIKSEKWISETKGIRLHAMHQDQVTRAPEGAAVFLVSAFCPISGFTLGNHFFGIQQHPDFTPELSADLITRRIDRIGQAAKAGLSSLEQRDDTAESVKWMADFIVHSLQSTRAMAISTQ